ncbi:HPX2 [Cordylochernes scorpioides]|uniref:HPX2 n=1 Tax=Cordylochernes scorpioides TaxID=51811 RepID=A0ABY6K5G3_9ARAC|nr:HPX2 [Cordylochernes scorpioides]
MCVPAHNSFLRVIERLSTSLNFVYEAIFWYCSTVVSRSKRQAVCETDTLYKCQSRSQITCNANSKYRTADGSCNNLNNPTWGRESTCFIRILPAMYSDDKDRNNLNLSQLNVDIIPIKTRIGRRQDGQSVVSQASPEDPALQNMQFLIPYVIEVLYIIGYPGEEIEKKEATGIHRRSKTTTTHLRGDEEDGGGSMERPCGPPSVEEGIGGGSMERPSGPPSVEEGIEGGSMERPCGPPSVEEGIEGGSMDRPCGPPSVEEGIEGGSMERPCGPPLVEEGIEGGSMERPFGPASVEEGIEGGSMERPCDPPSVEEGIEGGSMERPCGPPSVEEGIEGGSMERPCGPTSVEEGIEGGRYGETMWPTLSRGMY